MSMGHARRGCFNGAALAEDCQEHGPHSPAAARWTVREAALLLAVLALAVLAWTWGVGRLDICHSMEASRAVGARAMLRTGDYLVPRVGGRINLAKPPLFYWAVAGVSRICGGVSESTVRLPSALSALGVLLALYLFMRPVFGPPTSRMACMVVLTLPMVMAAATVGEVNMMLALGVAVSLVGAFRMLHTPRRWWVYAALCGTGLALGLMTKGPIVLLFFLPTVLLYSGYQAGGRLANDWRVSAVFMSAAAVLLRVSLWAAAHFGWPGAVLYLVPVGMLAWFGLRGVRGWGAVGRWLVVAAVALLLAAPWPVLVARRLGLQRLCGVLVQEMWRLRTSQVGASNRNPIWYYAVALPAGAFPWSLLVPLAFMPRYGSGGDSERNRILLLARCWLLGAVVLFTVISPARRLRYILPVFPALALLAADVLMRGCAGSLAPRMESWTRLWRGGVVYSLCAAPLVLAAAWVHLGLPLSPVAAAVTGLAAAGVALGLHLHRMRASPWAVPVALTAAFMATVMLQRFGYSELVNRRDSPRLACRHILARVPPGERLYVAGTMRPEAIFYLDPEPGRYEAEITRSGHALVCVQWRGERPPELPAGFLWRELARSA